MARRGGGRSASPSRRSPSPAARRPAAAPVQTKAPAPIPPQPTAVASPASPAPAMGGGGMMANIASTAAGVAIGHTVGHAITGAFSGGSDAPAPVDNSVSQPMQPMSQQQRSGNPCEQEFQRFLECTQEQSDISLCEGFNQVFKDCKLRYAGAGY